MRTVGTNNEVTTELVPKLRFPEFLGAERWKSLPLGDLCEVITKGSTPTSYGFEYVNSGVRFVKIESLMDGSIDCSKTAYITDECNNAFFRSQLKENDILFSIAGALGVIALVDRNILPANVNQAIGIVRLKDGPSRQFLLHQLQGDLIQSEIRRIRAGAAQPNISLSQLGEFAALLPTKEEQQKIADCLSSLDELIAAQARKVDALKTQKKGLMQQLFPREGETQPRLRFAEFRDAGEWVQKTVGDVSEVLMCKRIFAGETSPIEGVPFYKIGTLGGVPDAFISREKFEDYKSRYNYPRTGEVLITCSGTVGKCLPFDGKDAYFQDSNIVWLSNSTGEVSNEFLLMLISNVNWGSLNSTTITRIYGPDLRGVVIKYPEDEVEQQYIVSCLSSLDTLITEATQELETLKTHKKGLMQQLFPAMDVKAEVQS